MITHDEVFETLSPHVQEAMHPGWLADPMNRPGIRLADVPGDYLALPSDPTLIRLVQSPRTGEVFHVLED